MRFDRQVYVSCEPYIVSLFGLTWLERVIQHPPFRGDLVIAQLFWFASNETALRETCVTFALRYHRFSFACECNFLRA